MNLNASFKAILALSLVLGLSACATRNKPTEQLNPSSVILLPGAASDTSIPSNSDTPNNNPDTELVHGSNSAQNQQIEAIQANEIVAPRPVDLFERLRQGFRFPNMESKHIRQYEKWSSGHETYLTGLFERGTPFLFHIMEEIDKRGLPMELALLPAVESAYKPNALSSSQAGGLWQFIPSTGRFFGLRQDWWYDGRYDALTSTNAALDYLTQLNKRFEGDWFLTLAAYNAGEGTVSRAVKSNKRKGRGTHYQDLSLRSETVRYIPKLIALKNIINNPQAFGVELPFIESKPYFKVLELNGQVDLKKFAHDAGIKQAELRHLNAGFKRWATSPEGPHRLLIPINASGDIDSAVLAAQRAPKMNYSNHRIAQGDSLSSIARKYGVSVQALQASNNLRGTNIRAGKDLLIPVRGSQKQTASYNNNRAVNTQVVHHVKRGDTLWSIARKYKVQVNSLLSLNNISKNHILQLNQALLVMKN